MAYGCHVLLGSSGLEQFLGHSLFGVDLQVWRGLVKYFLSAPELRCDGSLLVRVA